MSRSRDAREEIQSQWAEVTHRSARFRTERQQNHFAELFRNALEGGHQ